ncbi:MAG: helix-turn-helix domain-containing protein [Burkholderiales bacterium]|nr:helix-turn-helix domain-containing protein [Burkholderiales bacterium]
MKESLRSYIQSRANEQQLSLSEVCRRADISRQTLYSLHQVPHKLPALQTIVGLASVLGVHPLRLLQLVFDDLPVTPQVKQRHKRGDQGAFIGGSIPDGSLVLYGQRFIKTWELQNVGRVPWENRYLQCMDDELTVINRRTGKVLAIHENLRPDVNRIPLPHTPPGETVTLSVSFTAPTMPCTCISYWKSVFEDGSMCFPKAQGLSVVVRVSSLATSAFEA